MQGQARQKRRRNGPFSTHLSQSVKEGDSTSTYGDAPLTGKHKVDDSEPPVSITVSDLAEASMKRPGEAQGPPANEGGQSIPTPRAASAGATAPIVERNNRLSPLPPRMLQRVRIPFAEMQGSRWMLAAVALVMALVGLACVATAAFSLRSGDSWVPYVATEEDQPSDDPLASTTPFPTMNTSDSESRDLSLSLDTAKLIASQGIVLHIPQSLVYLQHSLQSVGAVSTLLGLAGLWLAMYRRPKWNYICYTVVALVLLYTLVLVTIRAAVFYTSSEEEDSLMKNLSALWHNLERSRAGDDALCGIQREYHCSGFSRCCVTNESEVTVESNADVWKELCFLTLPNGVMEDSEGNDVTKAVTEQCSYTTKQVADIPNPGKYRSACPVAPYPFLSGVPDDDYQTPCGDRLFGGITACVPFLLYAGFTLTVLTSVSGVLSVAVLRDNGQLVGGSRVVSSTEDVELRLVGREVSNASKSSNDDV